MSETLVQPAAAPAILEQTPEFVLPADGAAVDAAYATFEWTAAVTASGYRFQVSEGPDFQNLVVDASVGDTTSLTLFETFRPDGIIRFARVQVLNVDGGGAFSKAVRFRPLSDVEVERERASQRSRLRKVEAVRAPVLRIDSGDAKMQVELPPFRTGTTSAGLAAVFTGVILLSLVMLLAIMLL